MTDNEIIKALECCADEMGCKKGCPCFDPKAKGSCCTISKIGIEKIALDLINRQQADIRKLQLENEKLEIKLKGNIESSNKSRDSAMEVIKKQQAEIERLKAFKSYFDDMYGIGLEIANWHLNGDLELFDNFYDSAIKEMDGEE